MDVFANYTIQMDELSRRVAETPSHQCAYDDCREQIIDDLNEEMEMLQYATADKIGLASLYELRKTIGRTMNYLYKVQKEAYEAQKKHYESCKSAGYFSQFDREYIETKKKLNEDAWREWDKYLAYRGSVCDLIQHLDPDDQDLGLDEDI
jgi:hypothetical protein